LREVVREPHALEPLAEEPVDARRYFQALRRHAGLILVTAVAVAAIVLAVSLLLPKSYSATAEIAPTIQGSAGLASASTSTASAQDLGTVQAYITSQPVLAAAARRIGRISPSALGAKVSTSLDSNANVVRVTATDGDAGRSAQLATGLARTFLTVRATAERAQLALQEPVLTRKLQAARAAGLPGLEGALQQQLSNVAAQEASAGSDLQLIAPAAVPGSPSSPRPVRNTIFAFVAALFLAVLAVAGRELISPSIADGRELSALIGVPILGRVPFTSARSVRRGSAPVGAQAYRFLAKALELAAPGSGPRLVAVTSAVRLEGKTTVVSRLGEALADGGVRTLLVSADLYRPSLHAVFDLPLGRGVSEFIKSTNNRGAAARLPAIKRVRPNLDLLTSGRPPADPSIGVTNEAVQLLLARLRTPEYEFVVFDLPPLLAVAETQLFVQHADAVVLVSRVDHATEEELTRTRELLDRLSVTTAGVVVLEPRDEHPRPANADGPGPFLRAQERDGHEPAPAREPGTRSGLPRPR
jgi:Mrp family chromosome partitioning ATPase/capsular polysaccharide biosynthesis protein